MVSRVGARPGRWGRGVGIFTNVMSLLRGRIAWRLALAAVGGVVVVETLAATGLAPGGLGLPWHVAIDLAIIASVLAAGFLAAQAADARSGQRIADSLVELSRRETELRATLENMQQGVAMYDAEYRLVTWNRQFLEYLDLPDEFLDGRHTFADYIRYLAERGEFGEVPDIEALIAQRQEPLSREHWLEHIRPDGTILEVYRNPIPGGGFITI